MLLNIPKKLMRYVKMDKEQGLLHHPDMPEDLLPLFEEVRKSVVAQQLERRKELESLLIKEDKYCHY